VPAVTEALSKGVLDGTTIPWEVGPSLKVHELVKHHTTFAGGNGLYVTTFALSMNKGAYDKLPADLKKVIDNNSGAALSRQIGKIWDESQAVGRKPAVDRGNTFYRLPAAEVDLWIRASHPLYDDWAADMDKRGLPGKQMLKDAQDLLIKYKK